MKNYTIFVTESITHRVSVKAKSQKEALKLLEKYTYNNDDAPAESEFYTKTDVGCETDFSSAFFAEGDVKNG